MLQSKHPTRRGLGPEARRAEAASSKHQAREGQGPGQGQGRSAREEKERAEEEEGTHEQGQAVPAALSKGPHNDNYNPTQNSTAQRANNHDLTTIYHRPPCLHAPPSGPPTHSKPTRRHSQASHTQPRTTWTAAEETAGCSGGGKAPESSNPREGHQDALAAGGCQVTDHRPGRAKQGAPASGKPPGRAPGRGQTRRAQHAQDPTGTPKPAQHEKAD